jgi:RNA polymerase sigma-70 factor, ECF subfamily
VTDSQADLMRALHDEHAAVLLAYVESLTNGDRARAQDVVQETLLRAWRHPHVLDQSQRSARAWLFTVARHIVVDQWRAEQSRPVIPMSEPPEQAVSDDTDQILQRWVVNDALRQLSEDHRQVLVECFYRGRSVAEAAVRLGIPQGTVKSRTHYALHALRLALEERG